jgi:hypothetical protein
LTSVEPLRKIREPGFGGAERRLAAGRRATMRTMVARATPKSFEELYSVIRDLPEGQRGIAPHSRSCRDAR